MRNSFNLIICVLAVFVFFQSCNSKSTQNLQYSAEVLDSIFDNYLVDEANLFRETYPFNAEHKATYLASEDHERKPQFSYLWPFSGSLSALSALYEETEDSKYLQTLDSIVLPGLEMYYDTRREPAAYASYIKTAPLSDRFYDDNIWLGIDFTDLYLSTGQNRFLEKAIEIAHFVESGEDTLLGGGIYWCEQNRNGKNTCSNAPGAVFALKLFEATKDSSYFYKGKELYEWTKLNLQDKNDFLYYDNKKLNGYVDETKYAYNSGQMLQSAAILYKLTKDSTFLVEAQKIAASGYQYFFHEFKSEDGRNIRLLNKGNVWFTAVMLRGYIELYQIDQNKTYLDAFQKNLDRAWIYMRDAENGLFNKDWSGKEKEDSKWLLTQFAMVEMYARMNSVK
ncbi:MAG: glycoside hydrolase family 76 protein [Paludibacter sp.]|jgi:mannose/cellobiose epimerase-like protein (N-acyl-D-glucosamine 2-epimerase family)|nr:glycoside hydrolase family 76 protein [Paludibacter sp.]